MAIQTRNSALAIKVEVTEAVPIVPSASSDYVALQDDFSMEASFETLDNAELKASIGAAKSILGLEAPSASLSHYLRHGGVEGSAPNYSKTLLKAAFGAEDGAGVEHDTVAGSTVSAVKVNTGEGATYIKGQGLLIKDPVNGYRIRAVESVSGNDLSLSFNVPVAPGTGVNLGEAITYYPANSNHPSLSVWHYLGNGGALQMMSGARVVSTAITAEAGQLVNASYSLEGNEYFFDPITLTSATSKLDFQESAGALVATMVVKTYKDPHDLAAAIESAMNGVAVANITVTYSNTTGKYTIVSDGAALSLLWSTGANTANTIGTKIGFLVASDDTGALTYTSDNAISLGTAQSPVFDSASPLSAKNQEVMVGDATDYGCFGASSVSFTMDTPKSDILSICAVSGKSGSIIGSRSVTVEVSALLDQYQAGYFKKFREGSNIRFQYSFGNKSGGNWVAGQCGVIYVPTATITAHSIVDQDGLVALNMSLKAYVNDLGEGEAFISFV